MTKAVFECFIMGEHILL